MRYFTPFFALTILLLVGCTPRLTAPVVDVPHRYLFAGDFAEDSLRLPLRWWELFGDSTLNVLVTNALASNRDLDVALARIDEARAQLRITRATYLPSFELSASAQGSYNRTEKIVQTYAVEPTISWEIPLFGQLRHASVEARAALAAQVWNYRGVELALVAEVATAYFTLLQYERDLLIARRTYLLRSESAALIDSMYRYGMSSGIEREQALSLVYTAEADIPRYRSAIEQTMLSLNVLLGETPRMEEPLGVGVELLTDRQPDQLVLGVPADLLQRRPDIMQAYYALQEAAAAAGVARSVRFPSITLTARGGIGANSVKGLTSSNPAIWSALGSIVAPIFNFSALRSAERQAVARYNQAALTYEQTVLSAFSEVEEALTMIEANRHQVDRYDALVDSYRQIVTMAHALYRNGMVNYLDVIDAERTLYTAQMQLVNLMAQQYINYVSLCKALGGGW